MFITSKVTPKIGLWLLDTFILPVIEYATEIWGDGKEFTFRLLEFECMQFKFIKMLLPI